MTNDNERWRYVLESGETMVVMHGNRVVGSVVYRERWHVEILWSGPTGDIKGDFADRYQAFAFVQGVEETLMALGLYHRELKL